MSSQEQSERISNLIYKLGDKGWSQVKNSIHSLVSVLEKDYEEHKQVIIDCICVAASQLPFKSGTYATLASLLNAKNFDIGVDLVLALGQTLQKSLNEHNFVNLKNLCRFAAELVNAKVLLPESLVKLLIQLSQVVKNSGEKPARASTFAYIIMTTLIWLNSSVTQDKTEYNQLLATLNDCSDNWLETKVLSVLKLYTQKEFPSKTQYMWLVLQHKSDESIIAKPYEWFQEAISESVPHELITLSIPPHSAQVVYPFQGEHAVLFTDEMNLEEKRHSLPAVCSVDRFVLSDYIADILFLFSHNHKYGSTYLLAIADYFNSEQFESQGYNLYEALVEAILLEIIKLPTPSQPPAYYATVLFDVFVASSNKTPQAVGKCLRLVFAQMDEGMDVGAIKRFGEWFSHHLSNFEYIWKWQEWEHVVDLNDESCKYVFVRETLEKAMRLAYYDRIKSAITSVYVDGKLFPTEAPKVNFKYSDSPQEVQDMTTQVLVILKTRGSVEELEAQLEKVKQFLSEQNEGVSLKDQAVMAHQVLIECVMMAGSKSFSHLLNVIERNLDLLQKYNETPEQMMVTIQSIASFWQYNPQFLEISLDKMVGYFVISPEAVIQWAVSQLNETPTRWFLVDVIIHVLRKANLKVLRSKNRKENTEMQIDSDVNKAMDEAETDTLPRGATSISSERADGESVDVSMRDQKHIYILTLQLYVKLFETKIKEFSNHNELIESSWWKWNSGIMIEIARMEFSGVQVTLDTLVFTPTNHPLVMSIWNELKVVYDRQMI